MELVGGKYSNSPNAKKNAKMSRWIFATVVTSAVIFLGFQTYVYADKILQSRETWGETERSIIDSNINFTLNLYKHITEQSNTESVFFSPFSISAALGMTLLGSRGNTSQQIAEAFSLDSDVSYEDVHGAFKYVMREMLSQNESKHTLHVANKLFVHKDFKVLETFQGESTFFYDTKLTQLDFVGDTESSRGFINQWAAKVTRDKIQDLLKPGVIGSDTRLVLANGIYFKGDWVYKFDKSSTAKRPFFVTEREKVMVDMMHQKGSFLMSYIPHLDSQVLCLSYAGSALSMYIILPTDIMGIHEVENKLTAELIQTMSTKLRKIHTHVYLPKFKLTQEYDLVDTLSKLGIKDLFAIGSADLSGINGGKDLHMSHVIHKAFIDVTESGSEAAAATAATIAVLSAEATNQKITFKADHPFLFYIQDNKYGAILFHGRYMGKKPNRRSEL